VNPGLHCCTRNKEAVTSPAKQPSLIARKMYPLLHGYASCQFNAPIAPDWVFREKSGSLLKENVDTL
jgi:hypothetical protein